MALPIILIQLGIGVSLWALNKYVLADDPDSPAKPPPKGLRLPRAGVGTTFPLAYGSYRIDTPVMLWQGNQVIVPESVSAPSSRHIDLLLGVGIAPSDVHTNWRADNPPQLIAIWVNGERYQFPTPLSHGERAPVVLDLGGRGGGGIFNADIEFFDGRPNQSITGGTGIETAMGLANLGIPLDPTLIPGYEHQMLVSILTSTGAIGVGTGSVGEGTNLVSIGFEVRALGPEPILVDGANYEANPALLLYDLICGTVYKLGYDTALVDLASFDAAATTLIAEGHGCSGVFGVDGDATRLIVALLDEINGLILEDHTTGTLRLKLIRADYTIGTLPVLDFSNTIGIPDITFIGWGELVNQVDVEFTDRELNFEQSLAPAQRGASAVGQSNQIRSRTVPYPCVHSRVLAASLAARELNIAARPLMVGNVRVMRTMHALRQGDVILAGWPGIVEDVPFRVVEIDQGQPADGGIALKLVEDVFDDVAGAYVPPESTPGPYLLPIVDRLAVEAPWWLQYQAFVEGEVPAADLELVLAVAANRYDPVATAMRTWAPRPFVDGSWLPDVPGSAAYLTFGTLAAAYPRTADPYDTTTGIQITASTRLATLLAAQALHAEPSVASLQLGSRLCVIYDSTGAHEFLAYATSAVGGAGSHTLQKVWRGLMDTAPRDWAIGARVAYLGTDFLSHVGRRHRQETPTQVRWEPTASGLSGADVRVTDTLAIAARNANPLPAQDFAVTGLQAAGTTGIGGSGYLKAVTSLDGSLSTDARPRLRTLPVLTRGNSADQGTEAGTTYTLIGQRVAANGLTLEEGEITLASGLTSPVQAGVLLGKVGHGSIELKLRTFNGGLASWTDPAVRVEAAPYRNLLRNGNGAEADEFGYAAGWTQEASNPLELGGTAPRTYLISRAASLFGGVTWIYYDCINSQTVDVSGYPPAGLAATLTWQAQAVLGGAGDYQIDLIPLDAAGVTLAGTVSTGTVTAPVTLWKTVEISIATLPANTAQLRVRITSLAYDVSIGLAEMRLILGQQGAQLLTNPTFDT